MTAPSRSGTVPRLPRFMMCNKIIGELPTSESSSQPAYPATVGYDLATGLGSVNATNLFDAWPTASK